MTREEIITYCQTLGNVYEDYPFHDENWTVMRHAMDHKTFAYIFEYQGKLCINYKGDISYIELCRNMYPFVSPGYHMCKRYWNTITLEKDTPKEAVFSMIDHSFEVTRPKLKKKRKNSIDHH